MKSYLSQIELIAHELGIKSFNREEVKDWIKSNAHALPSIESIKRQWGLFNPEEYGDPFGIITFWADKQQAEWDANQDSPAMFPKSTDQSLGYSLMMNNIRRGS